MLVSDDYTLHGEPSIVFGDFGDRAFAAASPGL